MPSNKGQRLREEKERGQGRGREVAQSHTCLRVVVGGLIKALSFLVDSY